MGEKGQLVRAFAPGNVIVLEYVDVPGTLKSCSTRVADLEESYIILQAPLVKGRPLLFRESQELTLRRLDSEQKEAYMTSVFVIDIRQGELPMLVCSKPKKIKKTSFRRFSRFNVNMPLSYNIPEQVKERSGWIRDLSLSGCYALIDPEPRVSEGSDVEFYVTIPGEEKEFFLEGRIIRIDDLAEGDKSKIGVAVDFYELTDEMLETLYSYIFQLQLTTDRPPGPVPDVEEL